MMAPTTPAMYATIAIRACALPAGVGASPGMSVSASASAADPTPHTQRSATPAKADAGDAEVRRQRRDQHQRGQAADDEGRLHDPRRAAAGEPAHAHGQRALVRVEHLGHDDEDRPGDDEGGGDCGEHVHGASLQEPGLEGQARRRLPASGGIAAPSGPRVDGASGPECPSPLSSRAMDVRAQWYDLLSTRISRRRFDGRSVPPELREQLEVFCDGANAPAGAPDSPSVQPGAVTAPARVCLVDDPAQQLFTGLIGGYGKVTGTPLAAAFIGRAPSGDDVPDDVQAAVGYLGEGFILEATRLGLGTCWIAGSFDHAGAARSGGARLRRAGGRGHAAGLSRRRSRPAASACCAPWSRRRRA